MMCCLGFVSSPPTNHIKPPLFRNPLLFPYSLPMENLRTTHLLLPPSSQLSSPNFRTRKRRKPIISCSKSNPPSDQIPRTLTLTLTLPSIFSIPDWADAVKELGMKKKRPLYTPSDWRAHRSSRRHLRHLFSSLSSRVILSLVPPVISFTSAAAVLAAYNSSVTAGLLPDCFPLLRSSSLPYQLTAPALALLLVFRTEASYSRFQEGRKCWMRVLAGAHEMAALLMGATGRRGSDSYDDNASIKKALLRYIMAFPVALKCHVIDDSNIKEDLQNLLEEDDIAVIMRSKNRPRCVIEFISQSLRMLHMEDSKRNNLESKLWCFHEGIGVCDQLLCIPIPLSYTRLTSRFLVLWHFTLPVILWDECNWIVVPATFISAASLFCIEEVGVLIEEPFPMLALDELCKQFHDNLLEAIAVEESVHMRLATKMKGHPDSRSLNGWPNS